MKTFYAVPILALAIFGCSHSVMNTDANASTDKGTGVMRVGMVFEKADTLLKEHGAKPTMYQIELTPESQNRGMDLHFYDLPSGTVMLIMSKPANNERIVDSISVSTYEPKSWESKTDPERDKFFESFKQVEKYDFE